MRNGIRSSVLCLMLAGCCTDKRTRTLAASPHESFDFAQSPYALGEVGRDGSGPVPEAVVYSSDTPTTTALMLRASDESRSDVEVFFEKAEGDGKNVLKSAGVVRPGMSFSHAEANVKRIILRTSGAGKGPANGRMIVF